MEPLITTIIPVYNSGRYLKRCLNSVCGQSYQHLEAVIIDDGSTDDSRLICEQYAKADSRIRFFYQNNSGVSTSRNRGIELARGDYIAFLDSDDWIEADLYANVIADLSKKDSDILQWGYYVDDSGGHCLCERKQNIKIPQTYDCKDVSAFFASLGYVWNKIYKKEKIDAVAARFESGVHLYEDKLFNLFLLNHDCSIRFSDYLGTHYVQHTSSLGRKRNADYYFISTLCLQNELLLLKKYGLPEEEINSYRDHEIVRISYKELKEGRKSETLSGSTLADLRAGLKGISLRRLNGKNLLKYFWTIIMIQLPVARRRT